MQTWKVVVTIGVSCRLDNYVDEAAAVTVGGPGSVALVPSALVSKAESKSLILELSRTL